MIDIHAHLCFPDFEDDREVIIEKCKQELLGVVIGTARYDEALCALKLSKRHAGFLFPTIGLHPTEDFSQVDRIIRLVHDNRESIVGIGEVGMDYHWVKDEIKRKEQAKIFSKFIALAEELEKPLVLHTWDAEEECFNMIKDKPVSAIFHCFNGKRDLAERIIDNGFYISISTQVLFSKNVRKIAKMLPSNRILLETDSPFLAPNKELDKRNYPWNIKLAARKIAELRHASEDEILAHALRNAKKVFNI
ncbi:MAG TPA: TatD family deoxyribonuclease [Candidatus Aenigmarchaeota archaeon]|nr:MAG: DNase [Candidatus Aenigmarchaeota archaeon]HDD46568.1 TatD family deoxyribonuclease [Candidatus Aenigmarchaeota archaeon]